MIPSSDDGNVVDLAAAIKPLATKEELRGAVKELAGEIESTRSDIAGVREEIKSLAPEELRDEMRDGFRSMDRRMMKLEGKMARLEGE